MTKYDPKKIEKKWQKYWQSKKIYKTKESGKKKAYVLDMFPYISGEGLHVGHPKGYIATDVYSRFKNLSGYNILHPMGYDAFGLPTENFAIKNKIHPEISVKKNIKRFKEQLSVIGFNYDWSREFSTTDPEYYRWTQWTFLQMYKKGLVYESNEPINWCPSCKTGLANEDLENGKCERCGSIVEKKPMRQWVIRITDYAERMLKDLDLLNEWPKAIKIQQENWIGKSAGAEIDFYLKFKNLKDNERVGPDGKKAHLKVFTTRADTLFGATYLVLSPEHLWVTLATDKNHNVLENKEEIIKYVEKSKNKTEIERTSIEKEKTGVEIKGVKAINPATGEEIPIFVADYVLADYGTGAIMAVPAHDERDFTFAKKYNLPIKNVVAEVIGKKTPDHIERNRVCAIVINNGKVLCEKIKPHDTKYPGDFILIGGGIEIGESPEEALKREVFEELGIKDFKIEWSLRAYRFSFYSERLKKLRTQLHFPFVIELNPKQIIENPSEAELIWVNEHEAIQKFTEWGNIDQARMLQKYKFYDSEFFILDGELFDSGEFSGLSSVEARKKIATKYGILNTKYKLRDWVFSRQRYWGEPIPLIHCEKCGVVPVPEKDLPVKLPKVKNYEPTGTGESPLASIDKWVNVKCPKCGGKGKRETNTMPQWAGSCWYYLRFIDPKNKKAQVDKKKEQKWMPVDLYVGGAEHATRHLIYARFWHKFLYDIGVVSTLEPFMRLHSVGLIAAEDGRKMSKRYGNVINPDEVIALYGADAFRVYEMFMGPFGQGIAWSTNNVIGSRRFLERVWNMQEFISKDETAEISSALHKVIKKVGEDIESFSFNTAISAMMIFTNVVFDAKKISKKSFENFLTILSPFAPHMCEEIWQSLGNKKSIYLSKWPEFDPKFLVSEKIKMVVQINGKVRDTFETDTSTSDEEISRIALALPKISAIIADQTIKKTIVIKDRVVNFVV